MLFWKIIKLLILLSITIKTTSSESDELSDFEFDSQPLTSDDDYYGEESSATSHSTDQIDSIEQLFDGINDDGPVYADFQSKEQKVKAALTKAWSNEKLKRKFSEVLPILKVLSSQQRVALAALVSAQIGTRPGKELNLDQVNTMFGNRRELILPLVFDIANLVRHAAVSQKYNSYNVFPENEPLPTAQMLRRSFEESDQSPDDTIGTVKVTTINTAPSSNMKDDRLKIEEDEGVIVNTKQGIVTPPNVTNTSRPTDEQVNEQRSFVVSRNPPFLEQLVQHIPKYQKPYYKDDATKLSYHERKLNMTAFNGSYDQVAESSDSHQIHSSLPHASALTNNLTLEQIEDLAFSSLNGTIEGEDEEHGETDDANGTQMSNGESLPTPEMLIGRYRRKGTLIPLRKYTPLVVERTFCEKFTRGLCLKVPDYPMDQIMGSIRRHKYAMNALLAEYQEKSDEIEHNEYMEELHFNKRRREDETTSQPGAMCQSVIRYARPQKARSASGEWKYIVNTGQHTQTLRLEKCSNPQDSCTYLNDNFRSRCIQIFNYHRLLSWDKTRGLHVDIFKVPTCCSCRIDGYREAFPPLSNTHFTHHDDIRLSASNLHSTAAIRKPSPLNTIKNNKDNDDEEDEEEEEDEEDSIAYQFSNGFMRTPKPFKYDLTNKQNNRFDRTKISKSPFTVPPTLEPYLSPPSNNFDDAISFKRGPSTSTKRRTRPLRAHVDDQGAAGSSPVIHGITLIPPTGVTDPPRRRTTITNVQTDTQPQRKVTAKLPNTATIGLDGGKSRVNYNYHPIIDFFEDETEKPTKEARIGLTSEEWKPIINGRKRL